MQFLLSQASFSPSESGEVGASYGSTPGPSSAGAGAAGGPSSEAASKVWLPDGDSRIFRSHRGSYVFGPTGFWTMAPLCYAAKFVPFLSLDCAPTPSTLVQSKERKGSNFAIWQPCSKEEESSVVSGDYPKILLMGMRRSGKSSITKVQKL